MTNERLRGAIASAGLSVQDLSERVEVDPKTIERWIAGQRLPHGANRRRIATVLGADEAYLWPGAFSDRQIRSASASELVDLYPNRGSIPVALWQSLLHGATESIDILALAASFLHDTLPDFHENLVARAAAGVRVRILLGDPESEAVARRGDEEGIGSSLADRCRLSWKYMRPVIGTPGIETRRHAATLYASTFRFDHDLLLNHHLYGAPANHSSVMHLRRLPAGRLFDNAVAAFDRVWEGATPAIADELA